MNQFVRAQKALDFIATLDDRSVSLCLIDPPYYGIVKDTWDNQWLSERDFTDWLVAHVKAITPKLAPNGSLLMFGAAGKHNSHPFFDVMREIESSNILTYRNLITWKKRRAYGKSHDYLFCREEIVWYSRSAERTEVTFNIPLLAEKRGYAGFNKKYPAKSEFKRVSNVWDDIPELMRPSRSCEKPIPLIRRFIETHSNTDDLVVDFFSGSGSTGVAARRCGRRFLGCEAIREDANAADVRVTDAMMEREEEAPGGEQSDLFGE